MASPAVAHLVDLAPIYEQINQALLLILTGLVSWIVAQTIAWIKKHLKFLDEKTDTQLAEGLNRALDNGVRIAMNQLGELEKRYPGVPVKNQIAAWAAQYAVDHSPAALQRFSGLTLDDLALKALAYLPPAWEPTNAPTLVVTPIENKPLPPAA